jgi:DNA-binding NtrC family response regulator
MPARIVVVHDDQYFREHLTKALNDSGYEAVAFEDSLLAWNALGSANRIEVLITRVRFEPGKPHGIALARWARSSRPSVRVLFTALPEYEKHTGGLGEFLALPVEVGKVVETVAGMLDGELEHL